MHPTTALDDLDLDLLANPLPAAASMSSSANSRGRGRGRPGPSHDNPAMLPHTPSSSGGRGGGARGGRGGRGGRGRGGSKPAPPAEDPVVDPAVFDSVGKPGAAARLRSASTNENDQATADAQDGQDDNGAGESCFICTEELVYAAFGPCNHRTCHVCSLRLRALYKDLACPFCKTEMAQVIITKAATSADLTFDAFEPLAQQPYSDAALKLWFDSQESYAASLSLLRFHCPDPMCDFVHDGPNGWSGLRNHVSTVHNMMMCEICTSHKHIFAHEHSLYPPNALRIHREHGDQSILKRIVNPDESVVRGHPSCGFCNQRFYGNDELYAHCRQKHEECFICQRAGVRNVYYRDYAGLEEHFAHEHFPCQHPECLEAKFVVFPSEIDLKAHMADVHAQLYRGQQRALTKEARKIAIDYHFPTLPSGSGRNGSAAGSSASTGLLTAAERAAQEAAQREREAEEALRAMSSKKKKNKKGKGKPSDGNTTATDDASSVAGTSDAGSSSSRMIRPPNSFGALAPAPPPPAAAASTTAPSSPSSSRPGSPTRTKREEAEDRAIAASPLLQLVFSLLGHSRAKLREFQSMSAAYMADHLSAPEFVSALTHLVCDTDAGANVQDVLDKIIDTCPFPAKRDALLVASRERLAKQEQQAKQQQRVLVIRSGSPNPTRTRPGIPKVPGWTSILPANRAVLANTAKKAQSASAWNVPKTAAVPVSVAAAQEAVGKGKGKAQGPPSAWIGGHAPAVMSGGSASSSSSAAAAAARPASAPAPPAAMSSGPIATGKKANKADFPSLPASSAAGSGLLAPTRPGWGTGTPSVTAPNSSSGSASGQQQGGGKKKGKEKQLLFRVGL